jgi:hypothetical protein
MSIGTLLRKAQRTGAILQKNVGQGGRLLCKAADYAGKFLDAADTATGGLDQFVPGVSAARGVVNAARIAGRTAQNVGAAKNLSEAGSALANGRIDYQASQAPKTAASNNTLGARGKSNTLGFLQNFQGGYTHPWIYCALGEPFNSINVSIRTLDGALVPNLLYAVVTISVKTEDD